MDTYISRMKENISNIDKLIFEIQTVIIMHYIHAIWTQIEDHSITPISILDTERVTAPIKAYFKHPNLEEYAENYIVQPYEPVVPLYADKKPSNLPYYQEILSPICMITFPYKNLAKYHLKRIPSLQNQPLTL